MGPETGAPEPSEAEVRRGGEFPVVYSQQVIVGASFFDFSLMFFQESYRGNLPVANVTVPPATAKDLAKVLAEYVADYERQFGEIRMPPAEEQAGS